MLFGTGVADIGHAIQSYNCELTDVPFEEVRLNSENVFN